ncbi:MAG TPA: tetratricopeptide repeat protein [Acidobacteriota bacterium]|nr:tetratricopeptide repeat protein [Acidobacteriota bacterium]
MMRSVYICLIFMLLAATPSSQAGTKEELMRLQSDVLALQNQIRVIEKTFNEQAEGIKSLVVQLNDQVGKSNLLLTKISSTLDNQASGGKATDQALLQEIRNLSGKIDDTATRLSALAQQVADMKVQSQPLTQRAYQSLGNEGGNPSISPGAVYDQAYKDLVQGNLDLAIEGFSAFLRNFPSSDKADDAQYYIGEAYLNQQKLPQAVAAFTRALTDYPSGDKVASAYYKRGKAELAMGERDNAIEDFKTVIRKYAAAPESNLAKSELDNLGVSLERPAKSNPTKRRPD